MNRDEHALNRLLKAARQSQHDTPVSPPFVLESKVLAHWRAAKGEDEFALLAGLFRRAVVWAAFVMIVTLGWSRIVSSDDVPGVTALANLVSGMQVVP